MNILEDHVFYTTYVTCFDKAAGNIKSFFILFLFDNRLFMIFLTFFFIIFCVCTLKSLKQVTEYNKMSNGAFFFSPSLVSLRDWCWWTCPWMRTWPSTSPPLWCPSSAQLWTSKSLEVRDNKKNVNLCLFSWLFICWFIYFLIPE